MYIVNVNVQCVILQKKYGDLTSAFNYNIVFERGRLIQEILTNHENPNPCVWVGGCSVLYCVPLITIYFLIFTDSPLFLYMDDASKKVVGEGSYFFTFLYVNL